MASESVITYLLRILPHSEVIQQSLRQRVGRYPEIALAESIQARCFPASASIA